LLDGFIYIYIHIYIYIYIYILLHYAETTGIYLKNTIDKLVTENAIVVKADKGKTSVIIYSDVYTEQVHNFLTDKGFQTLQKDHTDRFQKLLAKTLQQCNLIINKKQIKHLIQKKTQPPTLKAQIKMHKLGNPIRPVINNMNAPSHKIFKYLVNKLNVYLNPDHQFDVKSSIILAKDLTHFKINEDHRMLTYDIKDLYVNIPIKEILKTTKVLLLKHNNAQTTKQITTSLEVTLQQN
jgi:hypothetical protein